MDFFGMVLVPLVVNLGASALAGAWAAMRTRGRGWPRRLANRLEGAGGGVFSRRVLQEWLSDPATIALLVSADAESTRSAASELAHRIARSQTIGPQQASRAAEAVVTAAYLLVLEAAPDPQSQMTAWVVRQLGSQGERSVETLALLNDVAAGQNLQDVDVMRIRALVEEVHSKVMFCQGADGHGDLDVLVADDMPWTVGGLIAVLRSHGRRVATAETVTAAEQILRSRKVSVAVVDLVMPSIAPGGLLEGDEIATRTMSQLGSELGGLELVRNMRAWSPSTVIVVWSAVADAHVAALRELSPSIVICHKFGDHAAVFTAINSALGCA